MLEDFEPSVQNMNVLLGDEILDLANVRCVEGRILFL